MRKFGGAAISPTLIGEVDGKVEDLSEIKEDGVYEVKGYDCPVAAESCTPYGAAELRRQGYMVADGRSMIPFGEFVTCDLEWLYDELKHAWLHPEWEDRMFVHDCVMVDTPDVRVYVTEYGPEIFYVEVERLHGENFEYTFSYAKVVKEIMALLNLKMITA